MSVFSKYFHVAFAPVTCKDIIHPHTDNCVKAAIGYFFKPTLTTMQFFIPLFMISIAAKKDKIDLEIFVEMLKNFVGAVGAALMTGSIGTFFMCILYRLLGRFYWYTIVGLPGFLGALTIFLVPNQIAIMFSHSCLVMVTEVLIKRRGSILFRCMDSVIWFRTLVFMFMSAITLDSLRKIKPHISWFIEPVRRRSKRRYECYDESPIFDSMIPVSGNVCSHKNGCDTFIVNELKKYFKIGLAIEFVQSVLRNVDQFKQNAFKGVWSIITGFNVKFLLFAVCYPFTYRALTCMFNRLYGFESKSSNYMAAFFAGVFFYFYPQMPFLTYAIACTIEIMWQRLRKRRKFVIIRKINELPLARISYAILVPVLFHMRSFYPWQTPVLIHKVMNLVTCRHDEKMLMNTYKFLIPSNA
ncbi:transmembrane protein 135-like [Contarinia nasturtii]|uniref:transmembrane protein 135-like n=1 Tax=Contarinia nasturtii TaxID=265458 RepID=UPI0012D428FD|nr:transmembrane protein 135-like [Contarinia nasturtii]